MSDDCLFCNNDLHDVLGGNAQSAIQAVEKIAAEQFERATDEELVEHIYSSYEVAPIEIFPDEMEMDQAETPVDVSRDRMRGRSRRSGGSLMVPGLRVTVSFPFYGDTALWRCSPSSYPSSPPRAKIRHDHRNEEMGFVDIIVTQPSDSIGDEKNSDRRSTEQLIPSVSMSNGSLPMSHHTTPISVPESSSR